MRLVQAALLHQCSEAADAIWCKVQEIWDLERFAADARAACFQAGAGDLQFGLLRAGVPPWTCSFPRSTVKLRRLGVRRIPAPCPLRPRTDQG